MDLMAQLRAFRPWNEQEERDQRALLRLLEHGQAPYGREDPAHWTASAWVASPDRSQVLMAYHNVYGSWAWLGGHADGERDLLSVALREVREESGLEEVRPLSRDLYSLEILTVDGHEKRGRYVSSHLHLNVTFLLEADPAAPVRCKPDENSLVGWFGLGEAVAASTEPWFQKRVYHKLNAKLAAFPPREP
ncbi:NUDIX hydrolase [uncultured Oscillibacter sp.]|uniref:NUDIX hydrolase n=1 Tax=uncultured Oscillibacter sp. TaxID=876091 RepID=UPI002630F812|nr:NUDIX hydrolase [uncultured Oscillibacter sp.]